MLYEYHCKFHGPFDVYKPICRRLINDPCPVCKSQMIRVEITSPRPVKVFKEEFYSAFGKRISSQAQLKEELRKVKAETGKEYIEVGNDIGGFNGIEKKQYDAKGAYDELKGKLNGRAFRS